MNMPKLIAGNWKMNGLAAESRARVEALAALAEGRPLPRAEIVLCPPFTLIQQTVGVLKGAFSLITCGGQDCHASPSGAFTGNISAPMLKDLGCEYVILGHSERRQLHGETSAQVAAKAVAAHAAGLAAIICVGETEAERGAGKAEEVVLAQLSDSIPSGATPGNTVIAYEPVWAIGTGKVASLDDIAAMHAVIRAKMGVPTRLLYGGSVKGNNAAEILSIANVDGVLVGGASLNPEEFWTIAQGA